MRTTIPKILIVAVAGAAVTLLFATFSGPLAWITALVLAHVTIQTGLRLERFLGGRDET